MSSRNTGRIKQIKIKKNGSFSKIPIGANGRFVDMLSQLDLEEELKMGGNHYVNIRQSENQTFITEWYLSQPKQNNVSIEDSQNIVTHTCKVTIQDEDIDNDENIKNRTTITIELYQGLYKNILQSDKLLHEKIIYIDETIGGQIIINEKVENINGQEEQG